MNIINITDYIEDAAEEFLSSEWLVQAKYTSSKVKGCDVKSMVILDVFNPKFVGHYAMLKNGTWIEVNQKTEKTGNTTWNGDDEYFDEYKTTYSLKQKFDIKNEIIEELFDAECTEEQLEGLAVSIVNDLQDIIDY